MVEQIAPELVQRMERLVRQMADMPIKGERDALFGQRDRWMTEARAIVALLPEDPDLQHARTILHSADPKLLNSDLILLGIKKGRSLARTDQEPAHG